MKTQLIVTKTIMAQADELAREHESLDMHIAVGRQMLYTLLSKIYALSVQLDASLDREHLVKRMKSELADKWGIKTQENTSDATALVRYITRADRKTAHVYARAIEVAKANKIKANFFSSFVERQGGVERIRSKNALAVNASDATALAQEKRELGREYLNARRQCPYSSFKIGKKTNDLGESQGLSFFVCSEKDGRYYVLAKLPVADELSNQLLQKFSEALCVDIKSARAQIAKFTKRALHKTGKETLKGLARKMPWLKRSENKGPKRDSSLVLNELINNI